MIKEYKKNTYIFPSIETTSVLLHGKPFWCGGNSAIPITYTTMVEWRGEEGFQIVRGWIKDIKGPDLYEFNYYYRDPTREIQMATTEILLNWESLHIVKSIIPAYKGINTYLRPREIRICLETINCGLVNTLLCLDQLNAETITIDISELEDLPMPVNINTRDGV